MALEHVFTQKMIDEYVAKRWWPPDADVDWMLRNARRHPDKEAVVDQRNRVTWRQIKVASERLALKLVELGLKHNDVVGYQLPGSAEFFYVWYAALMSGTLGLPCLMQLRHVEVEALMAPTDAKVAIIRPEFGGFNYLRMYEELQSKLPKLEHIILVDDDNPPDGMLSLNEIIREPIEEKYPRDYLDQFLMPLGEVSGLLPTSGTTGLPKVTLAFLGYPIFAETFTERVRVTKEDVALACAPLSGGPSGIACGAFGAVPYVGGKVVALEKWNAESALELIEKEKVTIATGVPAQMIQMLSVPDMEKKYDLSSLRAWYYAGAVLPPDAAKEIEERMGCIVTTLYGIIGGGIPTQTGIYDPPEKRYNTVGKPMPGMTVEIRDNQNNPVPQGASGEICFKGALLCAGFWDTELMKEHMDDQRFYHTGDLGMFDDEGYLHIVGRKKDMIIRGGQNIIPVEIENMILTHPKVADVAIVGMPDPVMGEKVCAFVVPKEGETFSFEEMIRHLEKEKTAKYKLPERLEIINELPLSAGGKVQKAKLKEDIAVKLQEEMGDTK